MMTASKSSIDVFCKTLHRKTLYSKIFFETKRAMQNSLRRIFDNNCNAREEVSLSGHADISTKAFTTACYRFEKVLTLSC